MLETILPLIYGHQFNLEDQICIWWDSGKGWVKEKNMKITVEFFSESLNFDMLLDQGQITCCNMILGVATLIEQSTAIN